MPRLILRYLIPLRLARGVLPEQAVRKLLATPQTRALYKHLVTAIKQGGLRLFDEQLVAAKKPALKLHDVYLLLQKARLVALRTCVKQVWKLRGQPGELAVAELAAVGSEEAKRAVENLLEQVSVINHDTTLPCRRGTPTDPSRGIDAQGHIVGHLSLDSNGGVVLNLTGSDPFPPSVALSFHSVSTT